MVIKQLVIGCLILTSIIVGQEEFELSSSLSRSKIFQNESVTLTLSVKGADRDLYQNIVQPNLSEKFIIISTSQSSSFSFINGVSSRTRQYQYNLRAIDPGIFIIDPFKLTFKGKKYSTKPLKLVVRKGSATKAQQTSQVQQTTVTPQSQSIFIEATISTNNIFIGESIDYSVKLYRRISILSSISISQDDLQDVWQTSYDVTPEQIVLKNGQRYYELELMNKKISPLNTGEFRIPQLFARFVVDPFSGEYQLASNEITLNVNELPSPQPLSFSGAIGNYKMNVSKPEINHDSNAFQIQVMIQGTGNIAAISPPEITDTDQYRVLSAPKAAASFSENSQTFDYVIIPKVTGEIDIPPVMFSYYSRQKSKYITLKSPTLNLLAELENLTPNNTIFNAQEDIHFLKNNSMINHWLGIINNPKSIIYGVAINALILLGFIMLFLKEQKIFSSSKKKNQKKIVRSIQLISDNMSLIEMEKVLISVLTFYAGYQYKAINPKDVESSLIKGAFSDPLVKSTMQWIKNYQLLRYSKEKVANSNHSNAESLKRILINIVNERGAR